MKIFQTYARVTQLVSQTEKKGRSTVTRHSAVVDVSAGGLIPQGWQPSIFVPDPQQELNIDDWVLISFQKAETFPGLDPEETPA